MKPGEKIQYWLLVGSCKIVGALPDWFLYHCLLDILYFLLYKVAGYRVGVVRENLDNSFPEKSLGERRAIERGFYRNLAEIFVDTIDLVGISEKSLRKRMKFTGLEEHEKAMEGKDWIAALAHYGSWEYFSVYQFYTAARVIGVYHPLHNKAFDEFFKYSRSRFGSQPVSMNSLLRYAVRHKNDERRLAIGLIADQNPPFWGDEHWFDFLGRKTIFFMGIEKISLKFGMPVYFIEVDKLSRAHYNASFEMIWDGKEKVDQFEITGRYVQRLEQMIRRRPELWMWSHRRWKHKPPPGV